MSHNRKVQPSESQSSIKLADLEIDKLEGEILGQNHEEDKDGFSMTMERQEQEQPHKNTLEYINTNGIELQKLNTGSFLQSNATLKQILKAHEHNNLLKNQCKTAKDFMKQVSYQVPLNSLYRVVASCMYEEDGNFCPVLIKIISPEIMKENKNKPYLLQVWTKSGQMVFEKSLDKPVANWNISEKMLIYLEETHSQEINVVKLFLDKEPVLFKFRLPPGLIEGQINCQYDIDLENFKVQPEDPQTPDHQEHDQPAISPLTDRDQLTIRTDQHDKLINTVVEPSVSPMPTQSPKFRTQRTDHEIMQAEGMVNADTQAQESDESDNDPNFEEGGGSVTKMFDDQIIQRAPPKMIDYIDVDDDTDFLLLAYRHQVIFVNLKSQKDEMEREQSDDVITVDVDIANVDVINISKQFKIICLQQIDKSSSCLVIEDVKTRQIRFLHTELNKLGQQENQIKFVQLGILVNKSKMTVSPLLKIRQVSKTDPKTGKKYHVSIVVRENGRFEVYSDFMLVNEYTNPAYQCVDVETDFSQFMLRFVKNSHTITPDTPQDELEFEIRRVRHFWRNRISFSTSKIVPDDRKWRSVVQKRICSYFNLYSSIMNFSMYMLVSHRNMISIYDMTKGNSPANDMAASLGSTRHDNNWIQTVAFEEGNVRQIMIKKKPKVERVQLMRQKSQVSESSEAGIAKAVALPIYEKYEIHCIVGTHTIRICQLNYLGRIPAQSKFVKAPGQILCFKDDKQFRQGALVLTDNQAEGSAGKEYVSKDGCNLFTFPKQSDQITLHVLKHQKFHPLLSSSEADVGDCLAHDTQVIVMKSNRQLFEYHSNEFASAEVVDNCDVRDHFKDKAQIPIVLITSSSKQSTKMFPIIKIRALQEESEHRFIQSMALIKNKNNYKDLELQDGEEADLSEMLEAFYIYSEELEDNQDALVVCRRDSIKIYDSDQKVKLDIRGLKMQRCHSIHQGYLYAVSDNIFDPITIARNDSEGVIKKSAVLEQSSSGFYVFDLLQLLRGKIEKYKLNYGIGGYCSHIDKSKFGSRYSFIQSYESIVVLPLPHLNLINCVGMDHKNEYMIWRERNGFFTALDKRSNLLTWSLVSGKMLYVEQQTRSASESHMENYEVYLADEDDITYTRDFYNLKHCSLSLLKSKSVVSRGLLAAQEGLNFNEELLSQHLARQAGADEANGDEDGRKMANVPQLKDDVFTSEDPGLKIKLFNSQQRTDQFHFKVLELRTHEDTEGLSDCSLRFHFFFPLIRKRPENKKWQKFDWAISADPHQRLYLSKDTKRLMEVVNNFVATVYRRVNIDKQGRSIGDQDPDTLYEDSRDHGQQVKWLVEYRIKKFPTKLSEHTSVPYLFSPNFTYQIDFHYRARQFVIKLTKTQHVYMAIPIDLLNLKSEAMESDKLITIIFSRFKWESERVFRIVNIAENLDCMFEMYSTDPLDQVRSQRQLRVISTVRIDNQHENRNGLDSPHLLCHRLSLEPRDVLERLIRVNQQYKTNLQHALNTEKQSYERLTQDFNILAQINKIDYAQAWASQYSRFDIELSFTWLDWQIIDQVDANKEFSISEIEQEQQLQLCFNILPSGRSIMHILADETDSRNAAIDQISAGHSARALFNVAAEEMQLWITGSPDGCSFEVPILPDVYGQTALDLCLGLKQSKRHADSKIFLKKDIKADDFDWGSVVCFNKEETHSRNVAMADVLFRGIQDYGLLHSSQFITDAVIEAVRIGLPSVREFFEARFRETKHCFQTKSQQAIRKKYFEKSKSHQDYGALRAQVWPRESEIKGELFDRNEALQPMNLQFIDMPYMFQKTNVGFRFIKALAKCPDIEIFAQQSIQIIIDKHFRYWRRVNLAFQGVPMVIQLILFWYWSNIALPLVYNQYHPHLEQEKVSNIALIVTGFYLLIIEISQVIMSKGTYFYSPLRLFNLITPVFVLANTLNSRRGRGETYFWNIQAATAIIIWFRLLLWLRTIPKYSWLIRMISEVLNDMVAFMLVFFIGVLAFTDAFLSVESLYAYATQPTAIKRGEIGLVMGDGPYFDVVLKPYFDSFRKSFLVALGEFGEYPDLMDWPEGHFVVFMICCLFNLIVLLNLLIAIISETFTTILASAEQTGYKEKAVQMTYMMESIFGLVKSETDHNELIFVAKNIASEQIETEQVQDQIDDLRTAMEENKKEFMDFTAEKLQSLAQALDSKLSGKQQSPQRGGIEREAAFLLKK